MAFKGTKIVQDNLALALVCNILTLHKQAAQSFLLVPVECVTGVPLQFPVYPGPVTSQWCVMGHILGLTDKGSLETDTEGEARTNAGARDSERDRQF